MEQLDNGSLALQRNQTWGFADWPDLAGPVWSVETLRAPLGWDPTKVWPHSSPSPSCLLCDWTNEPLLATAKLDILLSESLPLLLCELTQAGNHQTMAEMQRVNVFYYLTNLARILKQHLSGDTQVEMLAPSGLRHPGDWQGCCLLPFVKGPCSPCCDLPCALLWSLTFDILSPETGSSSKSMRVLKASVNTCVISAQRSYSSKQSEDEQQKAQYMWFSTQLFSRPWHSQLQGYLNDSTILFPILLLLTLSSQQPLKVPKRVSPEEGLGQRVLFNTGQEEIKEGTELVSVYLGNSIRLFLMVVLVSSFYALPSLPGVCCLRQDQDGLSATF